MMENQVNVMVLVGTIVAQTGVTVVLELIIVNVLRVWTTGRLNKESVIGLVFGGGTEDVVPSFHSQIIQDRLSVTLTVKTFVAVNGVIVEVMGNTVVAHLALIIETLGNRYYQTIKHSYNE